MSDIVINNEKDLQQFLKLVAEESLKKSINEVDASVENYNKQKSNDAKYFKSLKEEEEPKAVAANPSSDVKSDTETPKEKSDQDEFNPDMEIKPRRIISIINNIRAGHSLKNTEVKENLETFLDKLDQNELIVLFYYLNNISKLLNQTITGDQAIDPSEDPVNITMTRSDKDQESKSDQPVPADAQADTKAKDVEDTSPPIKVNEGQDKEDIRRKIRMLMS